MNLIFVIIAMVIVIVFLVIRLSRKDSSNAKKLSETTAQNRALHQELADKQEMYSTRLRDADSQIDTLQEKEQQWILLEKELNRNIGQIKTLVKKNKLIYILMLTVKDACIYMTNRTLRVFSGGGHFIRNKTANTRQKQYYIYRQGQYNSTFSNYNQWR